MRQVTQGSTNISVDLFIIDDTDGTPELGVLFNTAGMDLEYRRESGAVVNVTEITLASLTTAHSDGGFLEIGHGYYRFDLPDGAFAAGAKSVSIQGTVTGMVIIPVTIQLTAFDMDTASTPQTADHTAGIADIPTVSEFNTRTIVSANYATQAQVAGLSIGAGGISTVAESFTLTTGAETLTYTSTHALDGITHDVADSGNVTDGYYQFDVGAVGVGTEIIWNGYQQSNGDSWSFYGYDWVGAAFVQIGILSGSNSSTIAEHPFILTSGMTGTAANVGKVRFRVESTNGTEIFTDRVLCEYTTLPEAGRILHSGVAQSGTINTIVLDSGASSVDEFYNHARIIISGGAGDEQERLIVSYVGSTKTAKVAPPWINTPDNTSSFEIEPGLTHAETGWATIKIGLVVAGTSNTITLDSDASTVDLYYQGNIAHIDSGTGEGQSRIITGYVGSTKVATLNRAWSTTPDTTSEYIIEEGITVTEHIGDNALALINAEVDTALADYDAATGAEVAALPTASEINAEMVDVLETDTHAEPSIAVGATSSLKDAIIWNKTASRNKMTQTATTTLLRNDADNATISTSTVSDDGTTFIKGKHS